MAITLVEELSKTPSFASGQKLLAYFFCESSSGNRTTVTGVLRGILYHLVIQRPELLRFILPKYNDRKATLFSSFDSLWGVLMDIVNDPATGTKYIIIDALDECDTESQKTLLKQFRQSFRDSTSGYSAPHVRILVTSRPYQEIREDLEQFNNKDLGSFDKSKRDVELFISERVAQFRARKKYTKKIADEVTRILKEKAGGTFLWIGIACDELDEKQSKDAIRYLQGLPSGLYSLYQRLLDRCVQSNPDEAKIKRLLSVIAVSRHPLSVSELSLVCELYIDEEEEERLIFTRDEIHSCRLLVVIQDDQVQLLHKSTKDFLHRHFISETKAHAMLAYRCVDRLIQYADANLKVNYGDVMKDSFLRYSVFFWMEHVRLAMTDFAVVPSQVDFFSVNSKGMESWLELYRRSSRKPVPQEGTIFHVAAAWNILPLIHHAIPMKGHDRQTKIYHDNVFKDKSGRTPLEIAAFFGHTDILSALLERLNENAVINEEVVIAAAQSRGSKEPMKLLLEQRGDQIPITEEVVKAAVSNSAHGKDIITFLLEQRGDQILVTEDMIKAAVSNAICGKEIMMFLFEQRGDQIPITEEVVKAAVRTKEDGPSVVNNNRDIEIIAFLIEQRGDQILITEEIVKDALRNPGAMAVLLEKRGDQIFITEKLFKAVLRTSGFMGVPPEQRGDLIPTIEETEETWTWYASEGIEIMEMLLGRGFIDNFITPDLVKLAIRFCPVELVKLLLHKLGKYFSITTEVMVAATRNEWHNEEMLALLLAHQLDPNFVIEDVLEEATYHKHNALHMMALLLDQANGQIAIAEQLVVAIATNGWESRNQLMLLLLTERYNYDLVLVTPAKVVELGARFFNAEVMTLLLDRLGGRVIITENLLMAVEQNKNGGDELKKILVSLTDQRREHNNNLSVTFLPSFYVSHVLHDHSDEVWVSEFSHSGNQLATGSMDGSIIIYDTLSFTIIHLLCAHGEHKPNEWVIAISWSPDDKKLVSCYWNGTIRMWNVITGDLEFHCYHRKATAAIFSIDGKTFISSSENRSQLHQWSDSGELLYSWPEDFPAVAWSLTPDGTQLITGDYSRRRIHVYDFQNHEKKLSLEFRERLTCVTHFGAAQGPLPWYISTPLSTSSNKTKEEVEDQKRLVASHREDNKTHMHMLKILQCKQFHEKFIQHGQNGGYEAARLLIKAAEDHIENLGTQVPPNIPYKIRVYANVEGLTKAYRDASILHGNENLTTFLQAFNKANILCDFVDAGNGKECADVKLKAHFEQDIVDVHCVRVVFCASADNGWARVLGPHRGSKPPFAREMEELAADFETTSFESVFMSHKLKSRRVSFSGTSTYITPPRTPTPDYASAAKKSPPIQSSPLVLSPTTPNGGQRVDSLVHYSSRENVEELKRQKLCNQFHLLGSCTFNDCTHKHGPALSSQKTVDLTYIARSSVCPIGIFCDNVRCTAGHNCSNMKCSGVNCRFPANMHGVDTAIVDPPS
ncbi:hypothetical protein UA08_06123 [Talaromyces atroroseus]|uniref:C3H1-type domain-containing protein n=1 Tax=Talaromyces atroroseus TaxID=1441469 RepID=A0A225AHC3_TALAT|nr:hypothetical protein UA08_06123 [Talaromyces atroroseus]OKL58633.1 hypothetical protein UA08_06123 [Talaromyces atroroseus]